MCGIAGIVGMNVESAQPRLANMLRAIEQRGPDDRGIFLQPDQSAALGHQRLAILDLSPLGHQPMTSRCGRYTIVFNGEIYNFRDLRQQLLQAGTALTSHSDTEVILELFVRQGANCLSLLDGMFALAIWDTLERRLFCARDPLGIKPFYYWRVGNQLAFASEVRSVLQADLGARRLDPLATQGYLLFGAVQEPYTLIQDVVSLPAGGWLSWCNGHIETGQHWQLDFQSRTNVRSATGSDYPATLASVRTALEDSITRHFVSDVPVGIFLSGGIDSTAVLALAHAQQVGQLQTFCIGFEQPDFDESQLAQQTARHFGTEHFQWRMTAEEGRALFHDFTAACDLPSNDGFNSYCVSRFAHQQGLKVVLSGLGGDELFGGYPAFRLIPKLLRMHRLLTGCGVAHSAPWISRVTRSLRYRRLLSYLQSKGTTADAYWAVRGFFLPEELPQLLQSLGLPTVPNHPNDQPPPQFDLADQIAWLETTRYMRNQLLRDSDVMSMAVGLELRTPLVDRKLMDVVVQVPSTVRLQRGKRLLTDAVPEIPRWILNQPKRGFRFPFEDWLAGSWKEMFTSIESRIPVPLQSWSRKWTLLLLEQFIAKHGVTAN